MGPREEERSSVAEGEGERCHLEEGVGMRRSSPGGEVGEKPHQITPLVRDGAAQSWQGGDISDTPVLSMTCFLYLSRTYQMEVHWYPLGLQARATLTRTWRASTLPAICPPPMSTCARRAYLPYCAGLGRSQDAQSWEGPVGPYTAVPPPPRADIANPSQHSFPRA